MRGIVKRSAKGLILLSVGAIFGPVLIAAVSAAYTVSRGQESRESNEASRLVEAYRERLPVHHLFLSTRLPEDGQECGYNPDQVFPKRFEQLDVSLASHKFSDYAGYWYMDRWRNKTRDEEYIEAIIQSIDDDLSDFETGFLRRCIEGTLFSSLCMDRVSGRGDTVKRFDHGRPAWPMAGYGVEDQIVCTYVDGVAARQGISLVERPTK
ncbi:hypothetical protein [Altererythrobacter sp. ZODW24]|uniref:hypothetical protein n=1 Tax=Altererythrobacter sp. ZODW24 TaxID=2185142 RepID=UPI0013B4475F|nr:hypothetical protein [Altererythrobacter sp. ZODW24]